MMNLALLFLYTLTSQAMPIAPLGDCSESLMKAAKFQDVTKIQGGLSAAAAISRIKMPDGSRCTGAYVSDQGHLLTASHCLEGCFKKNPVDEPKANLSCTLDMDGRKVKVRVLTMASCQAEKMVKARMKGDGDCEDDNDVAVVLPETPPASFSCLGISTTLARTGDAVMTAGHPGDTTRPGGGNSDGAGLYASYGQVTDSLTCSVTENGKTSIHTIDMAKARGVFIQTTVDIVPGSSGGPLINSRGEIVGVASFIASPHSRERECKGATFFEPLTSIGDMTTRWGTRGEIANMKCSAKKVKTKPSI